MQNTNDMGNSLLQWKVSEFEQYPREGWWYIKFFLFGLLGLIYAFFTANVLFAIIIFLIGFIVYLHHRKDPQLLDFKITEDGVILGERIYPYKNLKNFWIIYEPPEIKNLYFYTDQLLHKELSIPLNKANPLKVRKILLQYLPEDLTKEEESSADQWARVLKV